MKADLYIYITEKFNADCKGSIILYRYTYTKGTQLS